METVRFPVYCVRKETFQWKTFHFVQTKTRGQNPRVLSKIWRKNYNHCPFCAHRPHIRTLCGWYGKDALPFFYDIQHNRWSLVDCSILLYRLFLRGSAFCTKQFEATDCGHRHNLHSTCSHRNTPNEMENLKENRLKRIILK